MLEQYCVPNSFNQKQKAKQIYGFLTNVLQEFTYFFNSSKIIMSLYLKDENYQQQRLSLQVQTKLQDQALLKQLAQLQPVNIQISPTVFRRFICRMVELILPLKQQLSNGQRKAKPLQNLIRQLQSAINAFQKDSKLEALIQNLLASFHNFLKNIKNIDKCQFLNITTKYELLQRPQAKVEKTKIQNSSAISKNADSSKRYRKMADGVNLRFNTISCLDLDYQHFRSSFFMAKNGQQFYEEYLQRNRNIKSSILSYSKQFKNYLIKKKAKKQRKKLSFRTSTNAKQKRQYRSVNIPNRMAGTPTDKQISMKINNWAGEKYKINQNNISLLKQNQNLPEQLIKLDASQMRRTNYQMKSILMTASKLKIGPIDASPPNMDKKMFIKNSIDMGRKNNWRKNIQQYKKKNSTNYTLV